MCFAQADLVAGVGWGFPQYTQFAVAPAPYIGTYHAHPAPPSSSTPPHQSTRSTSPPPILHQFPYVAYGFPDPSATRRRRQHRTKTARRRRSVSDYTEDSEASLELDKRPGIPEAAMEPPATQEPQAPPVSQPPAANCAQHVGAATAVCTTCSQERTQSMIGGLADRVAGVEASVVTAMGRIADMLIEMRDAKQTRCACHHGQGPETADGTPIPHVAVATSTPTTWMRSSGCKKVPGECIDIGSDSHPPQHSTPQPALPRAASPNPPPDGPTDDGSHSVQNTGEGRDGMPTVQPPTKRTSAIPRMRPLPSPKLKFTRPPVSEEKTSATESTDTSPRATAHKKNPDNKKRREFVCTSLTDDSVPAMQPRTRSAPLRYGTQCWVMHPGFNNAVIGIARAGVNSRSRSQNTDLVHACDEGQQCILFKKLFRHDMPLLFPDDVLLGPTPTCDSVLWASGKGEKWVRWSCKYLRERLDEDMLPRGV